MSATFMSKSPLEILLESVDSAIATALQMRVHPIFIMGALAKHTIEVSKLMDAPEPVETPTPKIIS